MPGLNQVQITQLAEFMAIDREHIPEDCSSSIPVQELHAKIQPWLDTEMWELAQNHIYCPQVEFRLLAAHLPFTFERSSIRKSRVIPDSAAIFFNQIVQNQTKSGPPKA